MRDRSDRMAHGTARSGAFGLSKFQELGYLLLVPVGAGVAPGKFYGHIPSPG